MRIGVSLQTHFGADDADPLAHVHACAEAARGGGAELVLVGDKHASPAVQLQNMPLLGSLSRLLADVGQLGAVFLVPQWPTGLLLEQIDTLRRILTRDGHGPLVAVLAAGRADAGLQAAGVAPEQRASRLETVAERLAVMEDVELWFAAERGRALRRAGEHGAGWMANIADEDALVQQADQVRKAAAGRPMRFALRRDVICAATAADAEAQLERALAGGYRPRGRDALLVGDADSCRAQVRRFSELGFDDLLVRPIAAQPDEAADSIVRLLAARDPWTPIDERDNG